MSSPVSGFNGRNPHTHTHGPDIVLTLECGEGMPDSISLGDQIFFCHDQTSLVSFSHDIMTQVNKNGASSLSFIYQRINLSPSLFSNLEHKSSCERRGRYDLSNRTVTANTNPCDEHRLKGWEL